MGQLRFNTLQLVASINAKEAALMAAFEDGPAKTGTATKIAKRTTKVIPNLHLGSEILMVNIS